jgi:hypothetical protein
MKFEFKNVRLRYHDLFFAKSIKGGEMKYTATFLIPKGSAMSKQVDKGILEMGTEKWKTKASMYITQAMASPLSSCWMDGDLKDRDGFDGHMSMSVGRKETEGRPTVVDRKGQPLTIDDNLIHEGCWVNAQVDIYIQDHVDYGKAIRGVLLGVQFVKPGDAFAGGSGVAQFEILEDDEDDDTLSLV